MIILSVSSVDEVSRSNRPEGMTKGNFFFSPLNKYVHSFGRKQYYNHNHNYIFQDKKKEIYTYIHYTYVTTHM